MLKAFVASVVLLAPAKAGAETPLTRLYDVTLIDCYDGDTCTLDFHLSAEAGMGITLGAVLAGQKVRLCDIDTPELRGGTEETKAAAAKARDTLFMWAKTARRLQFKVPQKNGSDAKGKYGRWLGYLIADGADLNQRLLDEGLAEPYSESCLK